MSDAGTMGGAGGGGGGPITAPLGENLEANSVSVTLATDEEPIPVTSTQLPPAIGEQNSANSLSITFANDEEILPVDPTANPGTYPNAPTNVASANADTALLAANAARRGVIISNDSTAKLYVLFDQSGAGAASAANFTYVIPAGATFEMPVPIFRGRIRGFWSAANGSAGVTDVT